MKTHLPATRIPGARVLRDSDNAVVYEGKGRRKRPAWDKPHPANEFVKHFKNRGARDALAKGDIEPMQAYTQVPIYRGMAASLMRTLKAHFKYMTKLKSPAWKRKANRIRKARLKAAA